MNLGKSSVYLLLLILCDCGARVGTSSDPGESKITVDIVSINNNFKALKLFISGVRFESADGVITEIQPESNEVELDASNSAVRVLSLRALPSGSFQKITIPINPDSENQLVSFSGHAYSLAAGDSDAALSVPYEFISNQGSGPINLVFILDAAASIRFEDGNSFTLHSNASVLPSSAVFDLSSDQEIEGTTACLYLRSKLPKKPDDCVGALQKTEIAERSYLFQYVAAGAYVVRVIKDDESYIDIAHEVPDDSSPSTSLPPEDEGENDPPSQGNEPIDAEVKIALEGIFESGYKLTLKKMDALAMTCAYPTDASASDIELLSAHVEDLSQALGKIDFSWSEKKLSACFNQISPQEVVFSYRQCQGINTNDVREMTILAALNYLEIGDSGSRPRWANIARKTWVAKCKQ